MQCQALNLAGEDRCSEIAQDSPGLFCFFHSRQCYGLYKGYKRRNAKLDHLVKNPPSLLTGLSLSELDVRHEEDDKLLEEVRAHLFEWYVLLDRVIRARKLHHSRFFSLKLDYGHENFINQLSAQKTPVLRALELVVRRLAEVHFHQQKWFDWVRHLEDEDDLQRDAEKKRIKQEAALFQRHKKEIEQRRKELQLHEDEKRQDTYLLETWAAQNKDLSDAEDEEWDPIDDTIENEREIYLDLLNHFLWRESTLKSDDTSNSNGKYDPVQGEAIKDQTSGVSETSTGAATKSKNARKKARQKANTKSTQPPIANLAPGSVHVESRGEMEHRLRNPEKFQNGGKIVILDPEAGARDHTDRPASLEAEEIKTLLVEIAEIKELLFCRLLLSRASLLAAALKANSIEEFLKDEEIDNTELRDLCLRMEQPGLQEIRDACADRKRSEEPTQQEDDQGAIPSRPKSLFERELRGAIPSVIQTRLEKNIKEQRDTSIKDASNVLIKTGGINDKTKSPAKRMSVIVCGKQIYNYPSEKAMSRGGWLHFSLLAKDCTPWDATGLCRSWDEFSSF